MKQLLQILSPNRLFFILLALFFFQEGVFINKRVTVDEVWHSVPVYRSQEDGLFTVKAIKEGNGYSKLYQLAGYQTALIVWHAVFPDEILYSRIFSALFGSLILWLIYILSGRIWKDNYWRLLPMAFLAFDNIFFITSVTVRSDIIIASGLPLILLVVYDKEWSLKPNRLFLGGIISIAFASMHPNFLLAAPAFIAAYFIIEARHYSLKQNFWNVLSFASPFLFLAAPVLVYSFIIGFDLIGFITPYVNKTSEISAIASLNFGKLFSQEWARYLDFIQFPFRLHLFIVFSLSIALSVFARDKAIRLISIVILVTLILFLLLDSKTVRYFVLVLPLAYMLLAYALYQVYSWYQGKSVKQLAIALLMTIVFISIAGNVYIIKKYWSIDYQEFSRSIYFEPQKGENIIGDLILWDTFKDADFSAYPSAGLEIDNYDYVIARYGVFGNGSIIMTRTNTFSKAGNKKRRDEGYKIIERAIAEKGTLIKEVDNPYYGNFKIYKMNREKR